MPRCLQYSHRDLWYEDGKSQNRELIDALCDKSLVLARKTKTLVSQPTCEIGGWKRIDNRGDCPS